MPRLSGGNSGLGDLEVLINFNIYLSDIILSLYDGKIWGILRTQLVY